MSKTYVLQKDLPSCKAGAKFTPDPNVNWYNSEKEYETAFPAKFVENNPEWFKPEEKPERIEVLRISEFGRDNVNDHKWEASYFVRLSSPIDQNIFPLVKYHIERAINTKLKPAHSGDVNIEDCKIGATLYTQEQLNKAIENAFFAAREINVIQLKDVDVFKKFVYPTVISYMESLKEKS